MPSPIKPLPSQSDLKSLFRYDYQKGRLYWRTSGPGRSTRKPAGAEYPNGYRMVMVNRIRYYEHRLVFMYEHGYCPDTLEHVNGDHLDNRIENLRDPSMKKVLRWF